MSSLTLTKDFEELNKYFPKLSLDQTNCNYSIIEGTIDINSNDGVHRYDSFLVKLIITNDYPNCIPVVYELSNKIPKVQNRHISNNGECCLTIPHNLILEKNKGIQLYGFFMKYIIPYFSNQIFYDQFSDTDSEIKHFAGDEYAHDHKGIYQFYCEEFGFKNIESILQVLYFISDEKKLEKKDKCFCSSNRNYFDCHKNLIIEISQFGKERIIEDILSLKFLRVSNRKSSI